MSEPTQAEKDATKARMREALDVLQNYTTAEGKLDGTKLTQDLRDTKAENKAQRELIAELVEALEETLDRMDKFIDRRMEDDGPDWEYTKLDTQMKASRSILAKAKSHG